MNDMYRENLEKTGYYPDEIWKIDLFLITMCQSSHEYVVRVFVRLKKRCFFHAIMMACIKTWEEVWQHGTADRIRIGDVDDIAHASNWIAFENFYKALGVECPKTL